MTNLIHTCFILQYVYFNPLRVSSITVLSQHVHRTATYWEWRYQLLHRYNSNSWWWACNARNT